MTAEDRMNGLDPKERELDAELRFDIEQRVEAKIRAGMGESEARRAVRLEFGGIEQVKEECRDARHRRFVDDVVRDLRHAVRTMHRSSGITFLILITLALGIGANTAVFSVVRAVLLNPLPFGNPDRIVSLANPSKTGGNISSVGAKEVSIPNFKDWQAQNESFDSMAYFDSANAPVFAGTTAEYQEATEVSADFFRVFGIEPAIGRLFTSEETKANASTAALISYAYWQSHFGGDVHVLGRVVRVYNNPLPIVGVLPPGFHFPGNTDLWVPHERAPTINSREAQEDYAVGRLKPGVPIEKARADMATIASRLEAAWPKINKNRTVTATKIQDEMVGNARVTLYLLWAAVTIVLLIACANAATLLLGRALDRTREVAVRMALGANRRRIMRQLLTESLVLALMAGLAGLVLAHWGAMALVALSPADVPRLNETGIDRWVLVFTLGVAVATSVLSGLLPAIHASKVDLNRPLKQASVRSFTGSGMVRMRRLLVVAEIAMAVVLLSAAGVLTRSFVALRNVDPGFRPEHTLVMRATVPSPVRGESTRFFTDVLTKIHALPGVMAAGATMVPPGYDGPMATGPYFLNRMPAQPDWNSSPAAIMSVVAPDTFRALGIPLKSGRDFSDSDTADKPLVAVVNEALVRRAFPGESPIGRKIVCVFDSFMPMTIIGVVGDVRQRGPVEEPAPECYQTYRQHVYNQAALSIVVRTAGDPAALMQSLRRIARERSPDVPVTLTTMDSILSGDVAAPRFRALLLGLFAALAVCLAISGIYAVMAEAVSRRSNEIGLRMALGAGSDSIIRLVLRQGLGLTAIGLALGLAGAMASARFLTSMLFEAKPNDPLVYLAVAVVLGLVALVASYAPARRIARLDPATALRHE